jgi:hypothetical protein
MSSSSASRLKERKYNQNLAAVSAHLGTPAVLVYARNEYSNPGTMGAQTLTSPRVKNELLVPGRLSECEPGCTRREPHGVPEIE